jgi:hypothetical protein
MLEIARLLENALANNRTGLRKAAKQTVAKAPLGTTLRELLSSEAGEAIRDLTLSDLEEALIAAGGAGHARTRGATRRKVATSADSQSREEYMYRRILEVLSAHGSMTIGQIAKLIDVDTTELRGYLAWMRRVGKVGSSGKARATRYHLPDGVQAQG